MIKLDFETLDHKTRQKIVKGSVIPRPIAWITSLNETGSINLAPFSYFNVISSTLLMVSFQTNAGKEKDTYINLMREKEAVIHIVDESLLELMDDSAAPLAFNESELDKNGLSIEESFKISTPSLKEALIRFEVKLEKSLSLNNYENTEKEANLLILRIVAATINKKVYNQTNQYILAEKLKPVARLAGSGYSGLKVLNFKRKY